MVIYRKKIHCTQCLYEGKAKVYISGSLFFEICLWLCFLVPGFLYTVWRRTGGAYEGCPDCKSNRVVSLDTWKKRSEQKDLPEAS